MQRQDAIIYVAGNPDLYPLEYYDAESGSYRGAIPAFLEAFAQEAGYDLRYLQPGGEDRRADLADNQQVDLISGCEAGEAFAHTAGEPILLFPAERDGEEGACLLWVSDVAPEGFAQHLRGYAEETSQAQWTGALLQAAGETPVQGPPGWALSTGAVALLVLAAALAAALLAWRRERRRKLQAPLRDPRTGLGTGAALSQAFARLERDQSRRFHYLILFHLDLDHLGRLWGWERAQELLDHAAAALREAAGDADLPVRICEDDLLVLKRFPSVQEAGAWAETVLGRIRRFPFAAGTLTARNISAGVYPLEQTYQSLDQALFHARQCALAAYRTGRDCRLCGTGECRACQERWKLLADLPGAADRGEFQFYLQFFVNAHTFQVVGGEALSRWKHPQLGVLSPARYIPLLEEDGRIGEVDFFGLERTCAFLEELDRQQVRDFFISCNFSRRTFSSPDFVQRCVQVIEKYTFTRKLLILEVTESQLLEQRDAKQMLQNIQGIRSHGARVIFDDFGMGFSSFHDLQDYPMDGLKLDKRLVDNMGTRQGRIILNALVETGHRMGLTILAEGVEEDRQIELLQSLHCDVLQGYRFFVPLPEEEARRRILEQVRPGARRGNEKENS